MSDMVEKVARAIYERRSKRTDYVWPDDVYPAVRNRCLSDARAAIEAMREPDKAMLDAGFWARDHEGQETPEVYRRMIDSALSTKGE